MRTSLRVGLVAMAAMLGGSDLVSAQTAKIKLGDYRSSLQFISEHPEVVSERETDGATQCDLPVEAHDRPVDLRP